MKSPFNIKDYELTQVGDNIFTPKTWLDERVHESMKAYPNPYYEKPFIYKNINYKENDKNESFHPRRRRFHCDHHRRNPHGCSHCS